MGQLATLSQLLAYCKEGKCIKMRIRDDGVPAPMDAGYQGRSKSIVRVE